MTVNIPTFFKYLAFYGSCFIQGFPGGACIHGICNFSANAEILDPFFSMPEDFGHPST